MRNKGELSLSLASLPLTRGTHSRFPVLVAGFVESQCCHLGWALRSISTRAAHDGAPWGSAAVSRCWGAPRPLGAHFSFSFFHLHLFSVTLPFFFFFPSLSPLTGTMPPSIPIVRCICHRMDTQSCSLMKWISERRDTYRFRTGEPGDVRFSGWGR